MAYGKLSSHQNIHRSDNSPSTTRSNIEGRSRHHKNMERNDQRTVHPHTHRTSARRLRKVLFRPTTTISQLFVKIAGTCSAFLLIFFAVELAMLWDNLKKKEFEMGSKEYYE